MKLCKQVVTETSLLCVEVVRGCFKVCSQLFYFNTGLEKQLFKYLTSVMNVTMVAILF